MLLAHPLQLLETIEKNGEFESYVEMLADREDRERKELRRRERERKKLAYGDQFISETESEEVDENEESDWSATSLEGEEEPETPGVTDFQVNANGVRTSAEGLSPVNRRKGNLSRCSNEQDLAHKFNALRFLAMNLKSQNETLNK